MSFVDFVSSSPSSFHAAQAVARLLDAGGFTEQCESAPWDATPGGKYVRRDGAIIAYRLPAPAANYRFRIVGTHTDSPGFKLKPHPRHTSATWAQAGMEVYGGPLLNSWLDREFGLAGRVVLRSGEVRLVATPAWLRIPQLAPHLDRSVNESLHLDKQQHLMPVFGFAEGTDLWAALADVVGVAPDDIQGHDLFAYLTQPPEVFGVDQDFLASGRLDNLSSVYPGTVGLLAAEPAGGVIPVLAAFDHEEVGSATRAGAGGSFLEETLARTLGALGVAGDAAHQVRARSQVVSADAGQSVHPNYPGMFDPDEQPRLGGGPMLKVNASQRYTTDAAGTALWRDVCERAGIPCQTFVSNNAVTCGSTIGPITATRLGIPTVDVGLPILAMHSAREMGSLKDIDALGRALGVFFAG
ncbi:MAG: M18 family aminopeptidase [Propionibacteriaceae bacterium]|jgi:aspartyl aminopeptidase|nr:M18 family aminopeptidase [Propionibacteriaceae bacterium]